MAAGDNQAPVIIRKRKKGHGHEHHGGAWKVAYADFVTAMMAFFLILWLLNATDEEKRSGLADYFAPTSFSVSTSGGTGGLLGGQTVTADGFSQANSAPISVTVAVPPDIATLYPDEEPLDGEQVEETGRLGEEALAEQLAEREEQAFEEAAEKLRQAIEAVPDLAQLSDQLIIDQTPEGLRIQLVDQQDSSMFPRGSAVPNEHTRRLFGLVSEAVAQLPNRIAIAGHTDATPFRTEGGYGNWELSSDRALASRRALLGSGLPAERVAYVVGKADQDPLLADDPTASQNRRISITLLREARPGRRASAEGAEGGAPTGGTPAGDYSQNQAAPTRPDLPSLLRN